MNTCGLEACSSPCHVWPPTLPGKITCAPARCYCGGCPAFRPVRRDKPTWVVCPSCDQLTTRLDDAGRCPDCVARHLAQLSSSPPPPDAVPIDQAPQLVQDLRAELGQLAAHHLGDARRRAARERAFRRA